MHCNWADCVPVQIRIEDDLMYISNSCVFPSGWTTETLMERHRSKPYNPDIVNAFFRAGYVETWGRGIQKICEACRRLGTKIPEYQIRSGEIVVKFTALQSAKVPEPKIPKYPTDTLDGTLELRILEIMKYTPFVKQNELAENLGISITSVKRIIKKMTDGKMIERKGGKRYGYWVIVEQNVPK